MGQKVHPTGFRLGSFKNWDSIWYAPTKTFASTLIADLRVREFLKKECAKASVSKILLTRSAKNLSVTVQTARPGVIIGRKGGEVERLRNAVAAVAGVPTQLTLVEIRKPDMDATLVAANIASQLERRILFRRAMRRAIQNAMRLGAKGIKVRVSGRLNGAEIARCEWYREGRVPLHTLRSDIDYAECQANTTYGVIGVKVWIYKGELLGGLHPPAEVKQEESPPKNKPLKRGSR